jgi:hypothetical protein
MKYIKQDYIQGGKVILYETVQNYFKQVITKFAKCDSEQK